MSFLKSLLGSKLAVKPAAPATHNTAEPAHVGDSDFEARILQADMPAVVDFWAEWCGPCRYIAPSIGRLAAEFEGRAVIAKLDVDENSTVPAQYSVRSIPTVIYFAGGREVHRFVGVASYQEIADRLRALLPTNGAQ